jgi:hypothetical protein
MMTSRKILAIPIPSMARVPILPIKAVSTMAEIDSLMPPTMIGIAMRKISL